MNSRLLSWVAAAAAIMVVLALLAGWLWMRSAPPAAPVTSVADAGRVLPTPLEPAQPMPVPPAETASPTADDAVPDATPAPPLPTDDAGLRQALIELVGRTAVLSLLQTEGLAERIVATVDNLPRNHVAPRLWPVHPTDGRFTVDAEGRIALDNAERYGPFVRLVESVPPATAAAFYRRLQPQLQAAYEELGYPGRSFHTRMIEVIDHLLATPTVPPPIAVTLTEVRGPIAPERPWVRYEYAEPALESRSAGQRILLRVGEVHQRRLMGWLRGFRAQIAR